MFFLHTLGGVTLERDSDPVRFRSRKHLALFLYLVVSSRRTHCRSQVASLLWPTTVPRARHSLSQALYDVRTTLGVDCLGATHDEVTLDRTVIEWDGEILEEALRTGDLSKVIDLARGPFATNLDGVGTDDFGRWIESERTRLNRLAHMALSKLISQAGERSDWGAMCVAATGATKIDPLDPAAHVALVRGLWRNGDSSGALHHYRDTVAKVGESIAADALAPLHELAEQIQGSVNARGKHEGPPRGMLPLVGRQRELESVCSAIEQVRSGDSRTVVIFGDAGIGKSRLLQEARERAQARGLEILQSQCHAAEMDVPYGPVIDGLEPLAKRMAGVLNGENETPAEHPSGHDPVRARLSGARFARVSQLFPELGTYAAADEEPGIDPETWRRRLYEEVGELVRTMAARAPIAWFVEDLHSSDATSLSLLHFLSRRLTRCGVLLLMTSRGRPGKGRTATTIFGTNGVRPPHVTAITLQSLTDGETRKLLATAEPSRADRFIIDLAQRLSGGNPFYALELLRAGIASRALVSSARGSERLTDALAQRVLSVRCADLSELAYRILETIAVLDRHALPAHVASLAGVSLELAAASAADLLQRGLVHDRDGRLVFCHDILGQHVYDRIDCMRRATLHLAAAKILKRHGLGGDAALARHLSLAGKRRAAFRYAYRAACEAAHTGGHSEAIRMGRLALSTAPTRDCKAQSVRILADASLRAARPRQACEFYEELLRIGKMSVRDRIDVQLRIVEALAELTAWRAATERLVQLARDVAQLRSRAERVDARLEVLHWHFKVAMRRNEPDQVARRQRQIARIRAAASRTGVLTPSADARALCTLAVHAIFHLSSKRAVDLLAACLQEEQSLPTSLRWRVRHLLAMAHYRSGRWDTAEHHFQASITLARASNDLLQLTSSWSNAASSLLERGEWSEAEALFGKTRTIQEALQIPLHCHLALDVNAANVRFYRGDVRAALEGYQKALASAQERGIRDSQAELIACVGLAALQLGLLRTAQDAVSELDQWPVKLLYGVQERFKIEWFLGFVRRTADPTGVHRRLVSVEEELAPVDYVSYLKLRWIRWLLLGRDAGSFRSQLPPESEMCGEMRANRLGWFPGMSRRWLRAALANGGSLNLQSG